ncbi:MAG TPA: NAD(P)H-dependent oxidoreductase subunit E [Spirochaetota bacterium]|nr:NAD(P)H-dependent oxidoreductase subunit E [Spirochaetota bacterium]
MSKIKATIKKYNQERSCLLDIIRDIQQEKQHIDEKDIKEIAERLDISAAEVEGVVSFYHFFSPRPVGKYAVYLNNNPVARLMGRAEIVKAFEDELGISWGQCTDDNKIGLWSTSCIGMNDQEPAAIINGIIFTSLTAAKVKTIVNGIQNNEAVPAIAQKCGDYKKQNDFLSSMVKNNIIKKGPVMFTEQAGGAALENTIKTAPEEIISLIKASNLRGRGGAGFPTGMKWEFCRKAEGKKKYVVCNADEGEPGTFKDRVLLTEKAPLLFEGMAVGGYAVGAEQGILYLRAEYIYLKQHLENILEQLRQQNILGKDIKGHKGFNFDITVKLGAGAYICGEESALIESAEGKRGEPRNRPPFPAQKGYMNSPTIVNNVETFIAVSRIMKEGAEWFKKIGTVQSTGTKLLSISGDCEKPGVYEVAFGVTVNELLDMAGARDAQAVQVGGPSGQCIGRNSFNKTICYNDLATGGSIIIFGPQRDILQMMYYFMEFFTEESCGWCVPCRAGNQLLLKKLQKIINGKGTFNDIDEAEQWCRTIKATSRCGLGQTSPNPVQSSIANFRDLYESKVTKTEDFKSEFDINKAVLESCSYVKRKPVLEE